MAAWVGGKLRLVLEWLTVPLFLVALQLPHAPLCYWLSSSLAASAQALLLRVPAVRYPAVLHPPPAFPPGLPSSTTSSVVSPPSPRRTPHGTHSTRRTPHGTHSGSSQIVHLHQLGSRLGQDNLL